MPGKRDDVISWDEFFMRVAIAAKLRSKDPNAQVGACIAGTRHRGRQRQGNTENPLQAKVEGALSRILGQEIEVSGSGRTDAGTHARMQVASFRARTELTEREILSRLRSALPEDIAANDLTLAAPRFHARLSCVGKTYIYRVQNSEVQNVFERRYMHRVSEELDFGAMESAAKILLGEHHFAGFPSYRRW